MYVQFDDMRMSQGPHVVDLSLDADLGLARDDRRLRQELHRDLLARHAVVTHCTQQRLLGSRRRSELIGRR